MPGDQARTAQLVERTLQALAGQARADAALPAAQAGRLSNTRRPGSAARYFAVSVACSALLTVAVASAWQYARAQWLTPQSPMRVEQPTPRPRPAAAPAVAPPAPAGIDARSLSNEPATSAPSVAPKRVAAPSARTTLLSARELFTRGSLARRQGDIETAIALYEELCAVHPSSVEAEDARLVLGNLRLEQRAPRAALSQFESYGSGALSLEASWVRRKRLES